MPLRTFLCTYCGTETSAPNRPGSPWVAAALAIPFLLPAIVYLATGDAPAPFLREKDFGEATSGAIDEEDQQRKGLGRKGDDLACAPEAPLRLLQDVGSEFDDHSVSWWRLKDNQRQSTAALQDRQAAHPAQPWLR